MTATSTLDHGRHVWRPTRRTDLARAFRRARRHSRLVRLLRFGLPFAVVGGIALYALAGLLNPLRGLSLPSVGKLGISGTKVTMDAPRLAGFTRDGRSYEMTARAAAQDLKRPQFIELKDVRAKLTLEDGNLINVTADTGLYDSKTEVMTLQDNVIVNAADGTEVRLLEATLDVRKAHILSDKPVEVLLPTSRISANQLEVVDGGAVVHFRGGVRMRVDGSTTGGKPQETRR